MSPTHQIQIEPLSSGGDRKGHVRGVSSKTLMGFWFYGAWNAVLVWGETYIGEKTDSTLRDRCSHPVSPLEHLNKYIFLWQFQYHYNIYLIQYLFYKCLKKISNSKYTSFNLKKTTNAVWCNKAATNPIDPKGFKCSGFMAAVLQRWQFNVMVILVLLNVIILYGEFLTELMTCLM